MCVVGVLFIFLLIIEAATFDKPRNTCGVVCSSSARPFKRSSFKATTPKYRLRFFLAKATAALPGFVQISAWPQKYGIEPVLIRIHAYLD